jgi:hypothetical protein
MLKETQTNDRLKSDFSEPLLTKSLEVKNIQTSDVDLYYDKNSG